MDSSKQRPTIDLPLDQLIEHALSELQRLQYSRRSLRRYRTVWTRLIDFAREHQLGNVLSEPLAHRFVEAYRLNSPDDTARRDNWRLHVVHLVKILCAFARDGLLERARTDMKRLQPPASMRRAIEDYAQYARNRRYHSDTTVREATTTITRFTNFLASHGVPSLDQLQPVDIVSFIASRERLGRKAQSHLAYNLRSFLRFLLLRGFVGQDFCPVLPRIPVPRDALVPSVWEPELLEKLLQAVDRTSPKGRRDYAIMMLAARLGLRVGDIRALRLDDINWRSATIELIQTKTRAPLTLPIPAEVGEALIDYLQHSRPRVAYREVFLRSSPPFTPFATDTHLHRVIRYWKEFAGIRFRSKQHQGMHSLRHTLATRLLREQTPFHVISEILGHASSASTMIYAKDRAMPQVRGKHGQFGVQVGALLIPAKQRMDRVGVPQIVHARPFARPAVVDATTQK